MSLEYDLDPLLDERRSNDGSSLSEDSASPYVNEEYLMDFFFDTLAYEDLRVPVAMLDLPLRSPYKSTRPEREGLR